MKHITSYQLFEKRVSKSERLEIYRDSNIVIIAPLTHESHQKYATNCQWCINSDFYEWDEYHKGGYVLIIQRKPITNKIGVSGRPTSEEIYAMEHEIFAEDFHKFDSKEEEDEYYNKMTTDINSFDLNTVYYGNGVMYDKGNNNIFEYNRDQENFITTFKLEDLPNLTPESIQKVRNYLKESEHINR